MLNFTGMWRFRQESGKACNQYFSRGVGFDKLTMQQGLELGGQNLNLDSQSSTEIPILMVIILPKSFLVFKWEEGEGGRSNLLTLSDFGCVCKGEGGSTNLLTS